MWLHLSCFADMNSSDASHVRTEICFTISMQSYFIILAELNLHWFFFFMFINNHLFFQQYCNVTNYKELNLEITSPLKKGFSHLLEIYLADLEQWLDKQIVPSFFIKMTHLPHTYTHGRDHKVIACACKSLNF